MLSLTPLAVALAPSPVLCAAPCPSDGMGEHHDEEVAVWCNIRRTVNAPCKCCCSLCGGWVFLIAILAILARTSDDFVEFSIDVPFYNQDELNRKQQDAVDAMREDADVLSVLTLSSTASNCINSGTSISRNGTSLGGQAPSYVIRHRTQDRTV
eukprot:2470569-Prymnesium_polylepis.2